MRAVSGSFDGDESRPPVEPNSSEEFLFILTEVLDALLLANAPDGDLFREMVFILFFLVQF